jgi:hypothetical protein
MWLAITFIHTVHGWRVTDVDFVFALVKPQIIHREGILKVLAKFKTTPKVGDFCKRPHKYMEFTNG